jgi:F-type H+-transporting ATPase subunit gamma
MATSRDIRRRIKSVRSTAQITKAMQMVAASKMRRAQQAALSGRPYASLMNKVLAEVVAGAGDFTHPLMEAREVRRKAVILVSSDKGLCGALNSNLLREAARLDRNSTVFVTAGRKAAQFIARTKRQLAADFTYHDTPKYTEARAISRFAREMFLKGEVDQVDVLFTNFISTLTQRPQLVTFLPIRQITGVSAGFQGEDIEHQLQKEGAEFLFEPSAESVLGELLPHYLNFRIFQLLLESKASEHSARMVAMKSATDNANQLIKDLTLEYNKMRQASITKELLEITSAAMAMG